MNENNNAQPSNKYTFSDQNINSVPNEVKMRINTLQQMNKELYYRKNITESFFQFSSKKKAELSLKIKEADDELESIERQINTYYNDLFAELKIEKNQSILKNLNMLRGLLDEKNSALKSRKGILEERETQLNEKLKTLDSAKLEKFNQMMNKLGDEGSYDHGLLCDTAAVKSDYEKMKNKQFNQIANEISDSYKDGKKCISATVSAGKLKEKIIQPRPKSVTAVASEEKNQANNNKNKPRNGSLPKQFTFNGDNEMKSMEGHKDNSKKGSNGTDKIEAKFQSKMFAKK